MALSALLRGQLVVMLLGACACGGATSVPTMARLRIVATPSTARIELEEQFFAPARALDENPAVLEPGLHLVTIRAAGYFPHDLELQLPAGLTTVEVSLRPIPR